MAKGSHRPAQRVVLPNGMWLLLFLLGPGALGLSRLVGRDRSTRSTPPTTHPAQASERTRRARTLGVLVRALTMGLAVVAVASVLGRTAVLQGPVQTVQAIKALAGRQVVLAPEPLAEDLAAAGVAVWVSNPIDAFRPEDQAAYLDVWLGRDSGRRAIEASDVVVARLGSPALTLAGSTGCIEVGRATDFGVLACRH